MLPRTFMPHLLDVPLRPSASMTLTGGLRSSSGRSSPLNLQDELGFLKACCHQCQLSLVLATHFLVRVTWLAKVGLAGVAQGKGFTCSAVLLCVTASNHH